jgi:hypothetical protein
MENLATRGFGIAGEAADGLLEGGLGDLEVGLGGGAAAPCRGERHLGVDQLGDGSDLTAVADFDLAQTLLRRSGGLRRHLETLPGQLQAEVRLAHLELDVEQQPILSGG